MRLLTGSRERRRRSVPAEVHGDGRFVVAARDFVPAYLRTHEEGRLREKVEAALEALRVCTLCPRNCEVDRLAGKFAVCKTARHARVSAHFPHVGEEDVLRGWRGSGTIFFAWCNLRCVFCLHPDTRVLTDRGMLLVEDIFGLGAREESVGDGKVRFIEGLRVWTREGKLAPLAKAFAHPHRGELVVVKFYGLPPFKATHGHAVFVAGNGGVQKIPAGALTAGDLLVAPKPRGESSSFVPVREISREAYEGPVYNLEVDDEDHSYIVSGIAVGNCQNFETSQVGEGEEAGPEDLARLMLDLQAQGCHNVNFVTPEHVVPQILEALPHAIEGGLRLPLVYNTSAYDSLHSIGLMDGVIDVYMPDFKLWDRERCRRYLLAPDYAEAARPAIAAMHRQVGELKVDEDGLAVRGVLVRHLVMPGMPEDTREILGWLAGLSRDTYVNVMDQYHPAWKAATTYRELNRRLHPEELDAAYATAREAGLWRLDQRWHEPIPTGWL